jgi:hypothetical protein
MQIERQKTAHDKDQFKVIDERLPNGITVLLVLLFCCTIRHEDVTY